VAVKIEKQVGVQFALTPQEAMEFIKSIASYAMKGETFAVTAFTKSQSFGQQGPAVEISINGSMAQTVELVWSSVASEEGIEVQYGKEEVTVIV
jgi:hypothetical protein